MKLIYNIIRMEIENFLHPNLFFVLDLKYTSPLAIYMHKTKSKSKFRKMSLMLLGSKNVGKYIKTDIVFYCENDLTFLN